MRTSDRIFGAVMVLVALGYILSATTIQTPLFPDPLGPKAFPFLVAGGVIICGVYMVLKPDPDGDWPGMGPLMSIALAVVVLVAYAYSLPDLGFLGPTAVAAGILSYQLSPRPVAAVLTGIGLSIGLFVLFRFVLGLGLEPFPEAFH